MNTLHLDKKLCAKWDNTLGMLAWYGNTVNKGYPCSLAIIIQNAANRGGVHAR